MNSSTIADLVDAAIPFVLGVLLVLQSRKNTKHSGHLMKIGMLLMGVGILYGVINLLK